MNQKLNIEELSHALHLFREGYKEIYNLRRQLAISGNSPHTREMYDKTEKLDIAWNYSNRVLKNSKPLISDLQRVRCIALCQNKQLTYFSPITVICPQSDFESNKHLNIAEDNINELNSPDDSVVMVFDEFSTAGKEIVDQFNWEDLPVIYYNVND